MESHRWRRDRRWLEAHRVPATNSSKSVEPKPPEKAIARIEEGAVSLFIVSSIDFLNFCTTRAWRQSLQYTRFFIKAPGLTLLHLMHILFAAFALFSILPTSLSFDSQVAIFDVKRVAVGVNKVSTLPCKVYFNKSFLRAVLSLQRS